MNRQAPAARNAVRSRDRHEPLAQATAMNAGHAPLAGLDAALGGSLAADRPPATPVGVGPVRIRHLGVAPSVHPEAYVAPTAVLSGQVASAPAAASCTARCWPPRAARCRSARGA